jgi:hypothetical protein
VHLLRLPIGSSLRRPARLSRGVRRRGPARRKNPHGAEHKRSSPNWLPPAMLKDDNESWHRSGLLEMDPHASPGALPRYATLTWAPYVSWSPARRWSSPVATTRDASRTGRLIENAIRDAESVVLPVVRLSNVERPDEFVTAVSEFVAAMSRVRIGCGRPVRRGRDNRTQSDVEVRRSGELSEYTRAMPAGGLTRK